MKQIIAEIIKRPNDWMSAILYCVREDGEVDKAVTNTLLNLIELSFPRVDQLESLVALAEAGRYVSPNPALPDWGVNDTNIWLAAPMAEPGHVCVSNENAGDFSTEGGVPQQFTYQQFRAALNHWREFMALMAAEGKERLVGRPYTMVLPP